MNTNLLNADLWDLILVRMPIREAWAIGDVFPLSKTLERHIWAKSNKEDRCTFIRNISDMHVEKISIFRQEKPITISNKLSMIKHIQKSNISVYHMVRIGGLISFVGSDHHIVVFGKWNKEYFILEGREWNKQDWFLSANPQVTFYNTVYNKGKAIATERHPLWITADIKLYDNIIDAIENYPDWANQDKLFS